ncbi:hypothetical protein A3J21_03250 [Candidatus Daviesbacteria bacterium RIFCSPLOWO2_02_FULL_43_11]|nr:MAG: hypothetical protein A3J21_03250 [Candidatus Daviesbacteria bacterium RIFCSPLOWO2_02_FULL_43_11]
MEFFKTGIKSFGNEASGESVSIAFLTHYQGGKMQGGVQGHELEIFNAIPEGMVEEQAIFLKNTLGFKGL